MTRPFGRIPGVRVRSYPAPAGRRLHACVAGAIAALVFAACEATKAPSDHGVTALQFQDVVVPSGMTLKEDAHESYAREEAGWRLARYVYTGQAGIEDAVSYVRQRMPQHSWEMADSKQDEAGVRLRFERGIYRADYSFTRSADGATVMIVDYATDYTRR